MTSAGAVSFGYDGRGNLTTSGTTSYGYDAFNLLRSSSNGTTAHYDPTGRLSELNQVGSMHFFHDGGQMAAEVEMTGSIQRRYVWGDGADELITWYEGAGTTDKRWAVSDERGSVIANTDNANSAIAINHYDEYGIPQSTNLGRFQYTGQAWLPEIGMYYYKARIYSPTLGRFLQTDPIGYGDGMNMYAYVGNDSVNGVDSLGLKAGHVYSHGEAMQFEGNPIIVTNFRIPGPDIVSSFLAAIRNELGLDFISGLVNEGIFPTPQASKLQEYDPNEIVVAARRTTLPNVLPFTLLSHFLDGSGDTVCLTASQFSTLAGAGKRVGNLAARAGGGYAQQTSYYGGTYENSFGTATVYLDSNRRPVGFHDYYDFDAHGRSSVSAQAKTAIGFLGYLAGGKDFSIDYNNGICP